jgi:protoheme IX farnesyltransferase
MAFKDYYELSKPGIVYGNVMAAAAGFLLAARGHIVVLRLVSLVVGMALVIASACVCNNYIDRGLDTRMKRTKKRALVSGLISGRSALLYAFVLVVVGFALLISFTNALAVYVGLLGFFFYVVVYGIGKRATIHGTLIGTISGATPPLAGYVAASNHLDGGALLIFLIMVCWQMPHFYAIAMFRKDDYAAAGVPVWPVKKGLRSTKVQIVGYVIAFAITAAALSIFDYTGYTYLIVMLLISLYWLRLGMAGFKAPDDSRWARKMFGFSLVTLLVFCFMLSINSLVP